MDDSIALLRRIRYMMEYMTLCADPTWSETGVHPSPSGVPMGIVTLPDFVVDIALERIPERIPVDDLIGGRQIHSIDIGGRATRLAWALQMFGGETLGWYNVKLVTRAGDLGQVVLRRRFCKRTPESPIDPLSLRYVIPTENANDRIHVYGNIPTKENPPTAETALTVASIDASSYALTALFGDARYVIVASKEIEHAEQAIQVVQEGLKRLSASGSPIGKIPIGVLIDFSALGNPHDAVKLIEAYRSLKETSTTHELFSTALCDESTRKAASDSGQFGDILIRTDAAVGFEGCQLIPLALKNEPVKREAFTAGYIIASACDLGWKLLRQWYSHFPRIRPIDGRPHESFPQSPAQDEREEDVGVPTPWGLPSLAKDADEAITKADRLAFATLLAELTKKMPNTYREIAKTVCQRNGRPQNEIEGIVGLSGDCLKPRFHNLSAKDTLSLYIPPSDLSGFMSSCQLRDARRETENSHVEINKAVMFDLDATLLDSSGLLRACWFNGLRKMFTEVGSPVGSEDLQILINVYQTYVYKEHERFQELLIDLPDIPPELQPCDFRQVWNHPYAWAALLWVVGLKRDPMRGPFTRSDWHATLKTHKAYGKSESSPIGTCNCGVCKDLDALLESRDENREDIGVRVRRLKTSPLRDLLNRYKFEIYAGRTAFWETDYPAYPQARACVEMLRAIPGCEVYIVTEGHEETQNEKLKCTGLNDLFPRHRVLSTGAASAAELARTDLDRLKRSCENFARGAIAAIGSSRNKSISDEEDAKSDQPNPVVQEIEITKNSIAFLEKLLRTLHFKRLKRIYCLVIDAIRLKPDSPARVLQSFRERGGEAADEHKRGSRKIKFFMIGDRYDNDCEPLLDIPSSNPALVGVGTCRLLSGSRAKKFCPPSAEKPRIKDDVPEGRQPTMFVCDTLSQIAHILHTDLPWERVDVLKVTPPVLLEARDSAIMYPTEAEGLQDLAARFKDLAWARQNKDLTDEFTIQDMLDQIERDLAGCKLECLCGFFEALKGGWWNTVTNTGPGAAQSAKEASLNLLKGGLKILAGVNWWRRTLHRPLLPRRENAVQTLEWSLGSALLTKFEGIPMLQTRTRGDLQRANTTIPIDAARLLDAIPYSLEGIAVVDSLSHHPYRFEEEFTSKMRDWLYDAHSLP